MYEKFQFQKILHLADIHIRLYKRHDEYKQVFEHLYQQFRDYKASHTEDFLIVLAGDIVHAKTDMSPEMVEMVSDFLRSLADIAPTILLAGNHDMNVANPNRLDALSPLVENIQHPQLHYLKDSGIYEFGNAGIAVYSIMGDRADWPVPSTMRSEVKVGLYHGPLNNAKTDVGYTITGKNVELDVFDGLDMVLLGDIHRHQIMQFYTPTQDKPIIAYPGSLIQQNHGENLEGHGWLEWDVKTKDIVHHDTPNDYGYVTLEVNNSTLTNLPKIPPNVRLRLFTDNADASDVKKLLSILKYTHKINILEATTNKKLLPTDAFNNQSKTIDVQDVDWQNKLIREYISQNMAGTADEVVDRATDINKKLNAKIQEDELPRNISWRPLHLKFDNLFSYGTGNEINFETMTGLYGIFSPNATGKTSAFDALCFALYDKTPRAYKGNHIMNTRESECSCELLFEIGQTKYQIIRHGVRKKGGDVKVDVEFSREDNGIWTALQGTDRRDTNAIIRSYVGDYDDFVLTNLSVQNQNAIFLDKGQAERKDLLNQFMGLTIFDKLFDMATEESKEIAATLKRFNKDDFTTLLSDIQFRIDTLDEEKETLGMEIDDFKRKLEDINNKIVAKTAELLPVEDIPENRPALLRRKQEIEIELQTTFTNIEGAKQRHIRLKEEAERLEQTDTTGLFNGQPVEDVIVELEKYEEYLRRLKAEMGILTIHMAEYRHKIDALKTHKYDPNCKYCVNNPFVLDAKEAQKCYDDSLPTYAKWELKIADFIDQIADRIGARQQLKVHKAFLSDLQLKKTEVMKTELACQVFQTDIAKIERKMADQESRIVKFDANEAAILENRNIREAIEQHKQIKKITEIDLATYEKAYQTNHGNLQIALSKKDDLVAKIREAVELEDIYEAYECYLNAVSRDGIPFQLLASVVPSIQTSVNELLNQVVDFTIALEADTKNINGRIIYDNDRTWPLELASGMEKFIAGLALRVALMAISSLPRSNFLVIDEGFGVLDSENLASMFSLFEMLKTKFDFLVLISHLEVVRDISDNLIEIKRQDGYSQIIV